MCIFALAFGKQVAMTDACIGGRLLPPLYPRTHEVLGWIQGTRYAIKKRENRCPRNSRYSRDIENPNY